MKIVKYFHCLSFFGLFLNTFRSYYTASYIYIVVFSILFEPVSCYISTCTPFINRLHASERLSYLSLAEYAVK